MLCDSGTGNVALVARRVVPSRGVVDGARDQIPATRDLDAGRIDVHGLWRAGHLFHVRPPTTDELGAPPASVDPPFPPLLLLGVDARPREAGLFSVNLRGRQRHCEGGGGEREQREAAHRRSGRASQRVTSFRCSRVAPPTRRDKILLRGRFSFLANCSSAGCRLATS